jgi:hypothetical protein
VRHHRPFNVIHSDKRVCYDVLCKQGCLWGAWTWIVRGMSQWKITNVRQPHTCSSSKPKQVNAQCTARYLGCRILVIVQKDSKTLAPSLMESIFTFSGYRVKYSKAWRAQQHAMAGVVRYVSFQSRHPMVHVHWKHDASSQWSVQACSTKGVLVSPLLCRIIPTLRTYDSRGCHISNGKI